MNHLHFVQALDARFGGGLGTAAGQLNAALNGKGRESLLLSTAVNDAIPSAGVRVFRRVGPPKLFFAPGLQHEAEQWMSRHGKVVAHGHGFYVYPNAAVGRLCRRMTVPLIYHPHGMLEPWILARSGWKKALAHAFFEDANFRTARLWRALTSTEADQIRAQGIRAPIAVIPNGIDLSLFDCAGIPRAKPKTLLFLGRLHAKKGVELLLAVWAGLGVARGEWRLHIVGPGDDHYVRQLGALITSLGISASVSLTGAVSGAEKVRVLQSASAFVLTSYSEGFPMAVLEAMACRLPLLISRQCNVPEPIEAGAGWLCDTTVESVLASLKQLVSADDRELRERGDAGYALASRKYQWAAIADELDGACDKIA